MTDNDDKDTTLPDVIAAQGRQDADAAGVDAAGAADAADAEAILGELAFVFMKQNGTAPVGTSLANSLTNSPVHLPGIGSAQDRNADEENFPQREDMYRVLVEQIPALVFVAYLEGGFSEAYVSPQIESALGFSQAEWLEDPIRWYGQIHPEDKQRWCVDAAQMFLTGKPLKAAYRVLARDGRVVWFQCEAKMVRREDGRPWFLHGVGFDITELKQAEEALQMRTASLQGLSTRLLRLQDEERRRIARELHDSLGQYLVGLKMNIDILRQDQSKGQSEAGDKLFAESLEIADRCIHEIRTLSHLLHPPLLDEVGLVGAAQWYAEGFAKRSGVRLTIDLPEELERFPHNVELALFRILQESLTNVHRHSESDRAEIRLGVEGGQVALRVTDHGRGIPEKTMESVQKTGGGSGVGLSGMRERVKELGGTLEIRSNGDGTMVHAKIPLPVQGKDEGK